MNDPHWLKQEFARARSRFAELPRGWRPVITARQPAAPQLPGDVHPDDEGNRWTDTEENDR